MTMTTAVPAHTQTHTQDLIRTARQAVRKLSAAERQRLARLAVPRVVEPYTKHTPHPTQQFFLSLDVKESLFGGSAGGGKSDALLMAALQYVDVPGYAALILRRTWTDLSLPGAIMDRAKEWLWNTPATPQEGGRKWLFPSGARLAFGHLQYDRDKYAYQSAEFQFIAFDELTQFQEQTYTYLFSRIRKPSMACTTCGQPLRRSVYGGRTFWHDRRPERMKVPCSAPTPDPMQILQYRPATDGTTIFDLPLRMRAASNPGGIGHQWVKDRFIDPRTRRKGAVFVPSLLADNPSLDRDQYRASLAHLTEVDRLRLEDGDWDVEEEGALFQRHEIVPVQELPADRKAQRVRAWDMASTPDGDYTVGVLLLLLDGRWYIDDVVRGQWRPHEAEQVIARTAQADGRDVAIRMEQEPGSSGLATVSHYRRNVLVGYDFDGLRPTGGKLERAKPVASAAQAGNLCMRVASWNRDFLNELSLFPYGSNDDQVDGLSLAFHFLAFGRRVRLVV